MSERARNYFYIPVMVGLLAIIVIGLIPGESAVETPEERARRIAGELRCPFCSGESIAEAQSAIAADLRSLIAEQIASGMSDEEIFDYYVGVYTERVLLSPPLLGWGLVLWLLPALLVGGGIVAIGRRRRGAPAGAVPVRAVPSQAVLDDARRIVSGDLADLDAEEAAGEVEAGAAARLRASYQDEQAALAGASVVIREPAPHGMRRRIAGAAMLAAGVLALTIGVVATVQERAPGDPAGPAAGSPQTVDLSPLSDAELEAAVAANPNGVPLRLLLAARYFNTGRVSAALAEYLEVLERERHPEALANIGWITYLSGDVAGGLRFVEQALEVTDQLPQSYWYLANIRYEGLQDPAGAIEALETFLSFDLPAEVRTLAGELLAEVKGAL